MIQGERIVYFPSPQGAAILSILIHFPGVGQRICRTETSVLSVDLARGGARRCAPAQGYARDFSFGRDDMLAGEPARGQGQEQSPEPDRADRSRWTCVEEVRAARKQRKNRPRNVSIRIRVPIAAEARFLVRRACPE